MSYTLEGTLKHVLEIQTFGSGFIKREFVVTVSKGPDDKYPQHIKLCLVKDKVGLVGGFAQHQRIKVHFDIRGNEHNGRFFVELQAWKIEDPAGGSGGHSEAPRQTGYSSGYSSSSRTAPPRQQQQQIPVAEDSTMPF